MFDGFVRESRTHSYARTSLERTRNTFAARVIVRIVHVHIERGSISIKIRRACRRHWPAPGEDRARHWLRLCISEREKGETVERTRAPEKLRKLEYKEGRGETRRERDEDGGDRDRKRERDCIRGTRSDSL